jgi:hypothetical protein
MEDETWSRKIVERKSDSALCGNYRERGIYSQRHDGVGLKAWMGKIYTKIEAKMDEGAQMKMHGNKGMGEVCRWDHWGYMQEWVQELLIRSIWRESS